MQTIILVIYPARLANPDLDLRYQIPNQLEQIFQGQILEIATTTKSQKMCC